MERHQISDGQAVLVGFDERTSRLAGAVAVSAAIALGVVLSSWGVETRLGVPQWWPWLLTGIQVTALWAAGSKRWWGWLLGSAAQPPWIVYALLTGQLGFIPGCTISAAVQVYSYWNGSRSAGPGRRHDHDRLRV
jgi:hypothetical protein